MGRFLQNAALEVTLIVDFEEMGFGESECGHDCKL
jgi:hypothetical protein